MCQEACREDRRLEATVLRTSPTSLLHFDTMDFACFFVKVEIRPSWMPKLMWRVSQGSCLTGLQPLAHPWPLKVKSLYAEKRQTGKKGQATLRLSASQRQKSSSKSGSHLNLIGLKGREPQSESQLRHAPSSHSLRSTTAFGMRGASTSGASRSDLHIASHVT